LDGELTWLVVQNFITYNKHDEIFEFLYNTDNTNTSPTSIYAIDEGQNSQKQQNKTIHTNTYETPQSWE